MKNDLMLLIFLIAIVLVTSPVSGAVFTLDGTKHDLSSAGTGSYKAISNNPAQGGTSEICVFCHTPHSGNTEAPLWNRTSSAASYQTYTSDVLGGLGYWVAEDPKSGVAHSKTRICLSCHDGTIALGKLVNMPNDIPSTYQQIQMLGSPNIQPSSSGFIGLDLRDDHPVAIKHDSTRDTELIDGSLVLNVRLYNETGGKAVVQNANGSYIECTSCHNPHNNSFTKFLIASNSGSGLCTSCHTKRIGSGSPAHDSSPVLYNPDGAGTIGSTVGNVRCENCHYSHKAGVDPMNPNQPMAAPSPYLLSFQAEGTCFNKTNRWGRITTACHGNNLTTRDIESELVKSSAHKYPTGSDKHRALEANAYGWLGSGSNWHIDCNDCHNAHTAGNTKHVAGIGLNGNTIGNSSPLYGAGGVSIIWSGVWNAPAAPGFTPFESLGLTSSSGMPAQYYEYQICMKCHSSFAWGLGSPPNSPSLLASMTDQAKEFNPGNIAVSNASMHPVAGVTGNTVWGTPVAPWLANMGNQTMYCSDCHNTNGVNAQGPHGSSNAAILPRSYSNTYAAKGIYQSSGLGATDDLCFICHSELVYQSGGAGQAGTGFSGSGTNLHTQHRIQSASSPLSTFGYRCVNCHARVSHGYNRKAMIVRLGEGAPYEAGGTGAGKIVSVSLAASGSYAVGTANKNISCTTVAGCH